MMSQLVITTATSSPRSLHRAETPADELKPPSLYGTSFWLAYASNTLFNAAIAMLFRYADFVVVLGGTEWNLGWIVGIGMVGSLAVRLALGSGIDRYGGRIVWIGSIVVFAVSCFAHLAITSCTSVPIYGLRIAYSSAVAGVVGASFTSVLRRVPTKRMAEIYGMFGTATFVGFFLGAQMSDLLAAGGEPSRELADRMFWGAGTMALLALPLALIATRHEQRPKAVTRGPSAWRLLRRYQSGIIFSVAVVGGMAFQLPSVFLRAYTAELNISRIGLFFTVFGIATVVARVPTRRWPEKMGFRTVILIGLAGMSVSQLLFLVVRYEWQLAIPALLVGTSQAILNPAVVAAGSIAFPARNRGMAITLNQAAADVGLLIGSPAAGFIVKYSPTVGLASYPTLFVAMAGCLTLSGMWYALADRVSPTDGSE